MFDLLKEKDDEKNYKLMHEVIKLTLKEESNIIANLSNISSIINFYMKDLNWVGFYIKYEEELILGPFQGKPACIRIKNGKGVCGTASLEKRTVLVENVHQFEGHIACDGETNSEIVIPIFKNDEVYGVIDVDSPKLNRFTNLEKDYLEKIADLITKFLNKNK